MGFFKEKILRKGTAVGVLTLTSLVIYLFVLLGCINKGAGIDNLYWVSISQGIPQPGSSNANEVRIGYFGLCTNLSNTGEFRCFPRDAPPHTSSFPSSSPLLLASISLQKKALYPLPAVASTLFLLSIIYYLVAKSRGGRNKKIAKALLGISAALGLASALACMASATALASADEIIGSGTEIKSGMWLGVLLWIAASLHVLVVGYIACGMPGHMPGGGGSYGGDLRGGGGDGGGAYGDSAGAYAGPAHGYETPVGGPAPSASGPPGGAQPMVGSPEMRGGYGNPHMVTTDPYPGGGGGAPYTAAGDPYIGGVSVMGPSNVHTGGVQRKALPSAQPQAAAPLGNPSMPTMSPPYMGGGGDPHIASGNPHMGAGSPYMGIGGRATGQGGAPLGAAPPSENLPMAAISPSYTAGGSDPYIAGGSPYMGGGGSSTGGGSVPVGGGGGEGGGVPVGAPPKVAALPPQVARSPPYLVGGAPYIGGGSGPSMRVGAPMRGGALATRQGGAPVGGVNLSGSGGGNSNIGGGAVPHVGGHTAHAGAGGGPNQGVQDPFLGGGGTGGDYTEGHGPNAPLKTANPLLPPPNTSNWFRKPTTARGANLDQATNPPQAGNPSQPVGVSQAASLSEAANVPKDSKPWKRAIPFNKAKPLKASKTAKARKPLKLALTLKAANPTKGSKELNADIKALGAIDSKAANPLDSKALQTPKTKTVKPLKAEKRRTGVKPFKSTISLTRTKSLKTAREAKIPKVPTETNGLRGKEPPSWGLGPGSAPTTWAGKSATEATTASEAKGEECPSWGLGPSGITFGSKTTVKPSEGGKATTTSEKKGQELQSWGLGPSGITFGSKCASKPSKAEGKQPEERYLMSGGLGPPGTATANAPTAAKVKGQELPEWGLGPSSAPTSWPTKQGSRASSPAISKRVESPGVAKPKTGLFRISKPTRTEKPVKVPKSGKVSPPPAKPAKPVKAKETSPKRVDSPSVAKPKKRLFEVSKSKPTKKVKPIKVPKATRAVKPRKKAKPVKAKKAVEATKKR